MNNPSTIRAGAVCALVASIVLISMMLVGLPAGESMAVFGQPAAPEVYATALRPVVKILLAVMALDNIFVIAYTGTFIGAAALVWKRARLWGAMGLAFALLLAVLDLSENALTVNLARAAQIGAPIAAGEIVALGWLSQVKYASGSLALAFFAIALLTSKLPDRRLVGGAAALYLLFPLLNGLAILDTALQMLLIVGMWLMLLVSGALLWRQTRWIQS